MLGRPIHIGDVMTPFHSVALKSHYSKKITVSLLDLLLGPLDSNYFNHLQKYIMDPLYEPGDTQIAIPNQQKNLINENIPSGNLLADGITFKRQIQHQPVLIVSRRNSPSSGKRRAVKGRQTNIS